MRQALVSSARTLQPHGCPASSQMRDEPVSASRLRVSFTSTIGIAMLAVILIGFAPTFFLRAFFEVPEIPGYLLAHGAVSTAWFVWYILQSILASSGRALLHKRLGMVGAAIGVAVVASGIQTSLGMIPRRIAAGIDFESELAFLQLISSVNFAFFLVFPVLLSLAVYFRYRPDVHKRLMMILSISIVGPAAMRIASWFGDLPNPINSIITLSFIAALILYDIRTRSRPHFVTITATLFVVAVNVAFVMAGVGDAVVAYQISNAEGAAH